MTNRYCIRLKEKVELDDKKYGIAIYITPPEGDGIDEFKAKRVVGKYKKMLDAEYGVHPEEEMGAKGNE